MRPVILFVTGWIMLVSCHLPEEKPDPVEVDPPAAVDEVVYEYDSFGFRIDSMLVTEAKVKRDESLYRIFQKMNFNSERIYTIARQAEDVLDEYSFKPGQQYRLYASAGNPEEFVRFVWQPNTLDYVVVELKDSLQIYRGRKKVISELDVAAGVIETSLYVSVVNEGLSPLVASKLAEIFAWEIDFFGLRKNDRYRIVFEKNFVDGEFFSIGDILAAEFIHRGETYRAHRFDDGEKTGYFDDKGNSVQRSLLKAPFKYSQRISSGFSHSRYHPVLKRRMPHHGVDYAAPRGTPVLSVGDGTITEARYRGASGNIVKVRHNEIYETAYLHLSGFAGGVRQGARVRQGQVIGYVGNTGRTTAPHLDYRVYKYGTPVNPLTLDLPPSGSVPDSLYEEFIVQQGELRGLLLLAGSSTSGQ